MTLRHLRLLSIVAAVAAVAVALFVSHVASILSLKSGGKVSSQSQFYASLGQRAIRQNQGFVKILGCNHAVPM